MPVRIAICDDTEEDVALLTEAIYSYDSTIDIISFTDGESLIGEIMDPENDVDILFLDIYMPGTDGIDIARKVQSVKDDVRIIFISSSSEYYAQAYEVFAFNYLLKPFDRKRLYEILNRAVTELKKDSTTKICFTYKSTIYRVDCREIFYIESRDKLILYHMVYGSTLQCYGKLDDIEKELPDRNFIRCHKSYIVNASLITEMGNNYFRIGQIMISISKKYLKHAKEQYYAYLFSNMDTR